MTDKHWYHAKDTPGQLLCEVSVIVSFREDTIIVSSGKVHGELGTPIPYVPVGTKSTIKFENNAVCRGTLAERKKHEGDALSK